MKHLSLILCLILVLTSSLRAGPIQDAAHAVSIDDLRNEISARNVERAGHIREIQTVLRHQGVQERLGHLFDLEKVAVAVPTLDDETLARLARDSGQLNEQFRAGVSTAGWIGIVVGVILILWLILAVAVVSSVPDEITINSSF